eukprot:804961-Amphidinium_carterae.2
MKEPRELGRLVQASVLGQRLPPAASAQPRESHRRLRSRRGAATAALHHWSTHHARQPLSPRTVKFAKHCGFVVRREKADMSVEIHSDDRGWGNRITSTPDTRASRAREDRDSTCGNPRQRRRHAHQTFASKRSEEAPKLLGFRIPRYVVPAPPMVGDSSPFCSRQRGRRYGGELCTRQSFRGTTGAAEETE